MWPASTSTAIPSGQWPVLATIVLASEPSGFAERMWSPLSWRKNKRPARAALEEAAGRAAGVAVMDDFLCLRVLDAPRAPVAGPARTGAAAASFSVLQPLRLAGASRHEHGPEGARGLRQDALVGHALIRAQRGFRRE